MEEVWGVGGGVGLKKVREGGGHGGWGGGGAERTRKRAEGGRR